MTQLMKLWLVIAKSPTPINQKQIRAKAPLDYSPQTLSKLRQSKYIDCKNVNGAKVYTALEAPARLSLEHVMEIAKARQ